jgi:hypothetical protein
MSGMRKTLSVNRKHRIAGVVDWMLKCIQNNLSFIIRRLMSEHIMTNNESGSQSCKWHFTGGHASTCIKRYPCGCCNYLCCDRPRTMNCKRPGCPYPTVWCLCEEADYIIDTKPCESRNCVNSYRMRSSIFRYCTCGVSLKDMLRALDERWSEQ